jgi:integrase
VPKIELTDIGVRSLKAPDRGQITYQDNRFPGFGVRVSQGGGKSFVLVHGAKRQRITIGRYPAITLKEAREEAKRILAETRLGKRRLAPINFGDAKERFLLECAQRNRPRTVVEYRRHLDRHFDFGSTRLSDLSTQDVMARVNRLRKTPAEQNHAFVTARAFFNWAVRNRLLEHSPISGLRLPAKVQPRDRVLTDTEFLEVFRKAGKFRYPFGPIVRLLCLTGQRRNEIASIRWEWVDQENRLISFPSDATKNRRRHLVPYGNLTADIIESLPERGAFVFPARVSDVRGRPTTCFNGWSRSKRDFDATLENVEPYTLHDIRRTFSSKLAMHGTPIHVTERLLNHATGTISGVAAIYNRHTYVDEMRSAIEQLEAFIETPVKQ